ncbi:MAG: hypothetical protein JWN70_321 [Planctomycetaceae bacterium]|nr:hypothetical protein [Planctomycetaceae bacterium]
MSATKHGDRLARWVHWSLLIGVLISGVVLAAGLLRDPTLGPQERSGTALSIPEVLQGASRQEGVPLINLGLLLLMATPILRIAVLGVGWFFSGDIHFAMVSAVVMLLLIVSIALGIG